MFEYNSVNFTFLLVVGKVLRSIARTEPLILYLQCVEMVRMTKGLSEGCQAKGRTRGRNGESSAGLHNT
jgi:hypothetical protein